MDVIAVGGINVVQLKGWGKKKGGNLPGWKKVVVCVLKRKVKGTVKQEGNQLS